MRRARPAAIKRVEILDLSLPVIDDAEYDHRLHGIEELPGKMDGALVALAPHALPTPVRPEKLATSCPAPPPVEWKATILSSFESVFCLKTTQTVQACPRHRSAHGTGVPALTNPPPRGRSGVGGITFFLPGAPIRPAEELN